MKGLLDGDNWVDNTKSDKRMDKLGLSYVFCAGVSKEEFKSVVYAVGYLPELFVEKNVPFNKLVSKNSRKWHTLCNNATRSSLEDRPTRTESSSSNYPIHLLSPRSKASR